MIAVCIIGVLASVAIPAFSHFVMQAKAGEIPTNLSIIYKGAAAYWERPFAGGRAANASDAGHCLASACCGAQGTVPPLPPTAERRTYDYTLKPETIAIGFQPTSPVYAGYGWGTPYGDNMALCNMTEADFPDGWALVAFGVTDLDGDGLMGGMSLQAGIRNNQYYRAPGYGTVADGFYQVFGITHPALTASLTE